MRQTWQSFLAAAALLFAPHGAQAHFLWIVAGGQSPDGKVHVYFSESAEPDEPELLNRVAKAKLHQVMPGDLVELPLVRGEESLVASPSGTGPQTFYVSHTYGALTRGGDTFLLNYHAKCYNSDQPMVWTAVGNANALPLEITPRISGNETILQVTWKGEPLAEAEVTIEAEGLENIEGRTDKRGSFAKELPFGKKYSLRVKHVEDVAGTYEGTEYKSARHYATLALQLPSQLAANGLPKLDPPVTSFGGAIVGDYAYVYGGHLGDAHHYSEPGQSGRFARLNLKHPSQWEDLASVPKRTGLAMVPYKGKVIRIGGFVATNKDEEKDALVSMADVASYDPATNTWAELTALPKGRSSLDALVIGDSLYVVGGWFMNAGEETVWHDSALVADLTQSPIVWKELPNPPFHRRALSLGEWKGQLVAIGGMQEKGGPTKATAIYNPATQTWSDGPELQGNNMDGFGSSAFAIGDTLYVTTMSGKLQRLSHDGGRWDVIAQVAHPRFFHRMLPTADGKLLIVGGASMQTGKVAEVELIDPAELLTARK
ncbi:MAG: hypothetical protein B7Z55_03460 [Planctomycetales bacterium 12-60-4]|nr:MAG: hypothetical protein B7Z55_03460 [Planctomycetales bacterium 12-60-4]